jgi:acetolactate synthase-1/2/3 large subunit
VVIALSEEMQKHSVTVPDLPRAEVFQPMPDPRALERLQALLASSRKPLAVLGGSTWTEAGRADIRTFLTGNNLPVAVGFRRQALYDGTLPNFVGDLGVGSDPALVAKAKEADLILAIGTRLSEAVTQGYTLFDKAGGTPIVHVYPDPAEIGRVYRVALGIAGDVNAFARTAADLHPAPAPWAKWTQSLRALREAGREVPAYEGLNIGRVMRELEELAAPDAMFTCDAGNFATWPARFINFKQDQRFIGPTNGAMGYGVPAGVGAAIAFPGRQAIVFVGDGGMLMTGTEIATAFHHGVAPILLVFNNAMYGTIRMYQERTYPGRVSGTLLTNPDFSTFIQSFGGHGEVVERNEEFAPAFRRAVASGKPALIELRQNPEQITSRATISQLRAGAGGVKAERT